MPQSTRQCVSREWKVVKRYFAVQNTVREHKSPIAMQTFWDLGFERPPYSPDLSSAERFPLTKR